MQLSRGAKIVGPQLDADIVVRTSVFAVMEIHGELGDPGVVGQCQRSVVTSLGAAGRDEHAVAKVRAGHHDVARPPGTGVKTAAAAGAGRREPGADASALTAPCPVTMGGAASIRVARARVALRATASQRDERDIVTSWPETRKRTLCLTHCGPGWGARGPGRTRQDRCRARRLRAWEWAMHRSIGCQGGACVRGRVDSVAGCPYTAQSVHSLALFITQALIQTVAGSLARYSSALRCRRGPQICAHTTLPPASRVRCRVALPPRPVRPPRSVQVTVAYLSRSLL
jgi:hypothetical protein